MNIPRFSFEVSPRGRRDEIADLKNLVSAILKYNPAFIDLTFAAGGAADTEGKVREAIRMSVDAIREVKADVKIMPHLTANGIDIKGTKAFIREMAPLVGGWVLLGGDPIKKDAPQFPADECYVFTDNLIGGACDVYRDLGLLDKLEILVGVEPEMDDPLGRYKNKIDAGTVFVPGQSVFQTVKGGLLQYSRTPGLAGRFYEEVQAAKLPAVMPGYMPVLGIPNPSLLTNLEGAIVLEAGNVVLVDRLRVRTPQEFLAHFAGVAKTDAAAIRAASTGFLEKTVDGDGNIPHRHFYTRDRRDVLDFIDRKWPGAANGLAAGAHLLRRQPLPGSSP